MNFKKRFAVKFSPEYVETHAHLLTPREKKVTEECVFKNRTYEDVSKDFDVCQERIRQILNRAFRRLSKSYKVETGDPSCQGSQ